MSVRSLLQSIGIGIDSAQSHRKMTLPLYTPLTTDSNNGSGGRLMSTSNESADSIMLTSTSSALTATTAWSRRQQATASRKRRRRMAALKTMNKPLETSKEEKQLQQQLRQQQQQRRSSCLAYLPTPRRFWADFTLGFADGLTVPFALTAGLSSLGHTDTVLFAGLAEISAGCISMGIGGYLSARQTRSSSAATSTTEADEELSQDCSHSFSVDNRDGENKVAAVVGPPSVLSAATIADHYLAPLDLPTELLQLVLDHVAARPGLANAFFTAGSAKAFCAGNTLENDNYNDFSDSDYEVEDDTKVDADDGTDAWPVASGLSVAVGYLVGGMLPLGPYFCVSDVGHGVRWSFAVCLVALFSFGFLRDFFLEGDAADSIDGIDSFDSTATTTFIVARPASVPWQRIRKSLYEGLQMVVLGGIAAIVAVMCVRMFESAGTDEAVPV